MQNNRPLPYTLLAVAILISSTGCNNESGDSAPAIATTNTYMACVAKDLLGRDEKVFRLAGPGTCPGHFDISPSQVNRLLGCKIFLRFDFQKRFDEKLAPAVEKGLCIVPIKITSGLCVPDGYLSACRQVADALVSAGMMDRKSADDRLVIIDARVKKSAQKAKSLIAKANLAETPVLAAKHQAKFCRWLGLDVSATFSGNDAPGELARVVKLAKSARVKLIIANVPSGKVAADWLAEAIGADKSKIIMLDNFPPTKCNRDGFDTMLLENANKITNHK